MRSGTKRATINKYHTAMRLLVSRINRGDKIVKRDFTREFHLSHNFIRACIDLGYIENDGNRKMKSKLSNVQPIHARKVLEYLSNYTKEKMTGVEKPSENLSLVFDDHVSKLTNQQLIDELKKRGFSGKLERKIVETTEL